MIPDKIRVGGSGTFYFNNSGTAAAPSLTPSFQCKANISGSNRRAYFGYTSSYDDVYNIAIGSGPPANKFVKTCASGGSSDHHSDTFSPVVPQYVVPGVEANPMKLVADFLTVKKAMASCGGGGHNSDAYSRQASDHGSCGGSRSTDYDSSNHGGTVTSTYNLGQPTAFYPGAKTYIFYVDYASNCTLTWNLASGTSTVSNTSTTCSGSPTLNSNVP